MLALHSGLAALALVPEPPIAIPQQQVIQVSMVAPTTIQQEPQTIEQPVVEKTVPELTPKKKGMVKAKPQTKPEPEEIAKLEPASGEVMPKIKAKPKPKPQQKAKKPQAQTQLTSGLQSPNASAQKSAITKPVAANYLNNPAPEYPRSARKRGQEGTVLLDVRVSTAGTPKQVLLERSSGHHLLDRAALAAVQNWKFVPARRGSKLIEANVVVPIEFRIN